MGSNIETNKAVDEIIKGNHECFSAQLFISLIILWSIQSFIKSYPLIKISIHNYYQNSTRLGAIVLLTGIKIKDHIV